MKLIALDMDGTTLNSNKEISEENIKAIKKAQQEGHIVMILSGRPFVLVNKQISKHGLDLPIGGNNGTELYVGGRLLERTSLTLSQSLKIALELEEESVPYKIGTNKGTFVHKDWFERFDDVLASGRVPDEYFEHKDYKMFTASPKVYGQGFFNNYEEVINEESAVQKFLALTLDPKQKQRLHRKIEAISETCVTSSSPFNLEIMQINGNKGNGLKIMARHLNIPLEDTIVIGDEKNDLPMFRVAGLSIAMGNADEDVKKHTDLVTLTNDEHGVAYAIEKYVLKGSYIS
jgi:Cof subfamily protein (haloacid dehalogenase superfamily)